MKLTTSQLKDLKKAQDLINRASVIFSKIEDGSDLKFAANGTLSEKAKDLSFDIENEIQILN